MKRFFLAYANAPLKDNPQHFQKIFEQISSSRSARAEERDNITIDKKEIDKIIEYIVDLSSITDPQVFLSQIKKHGYIDYNGIDGYGAEFNEDLNYAVNAIAGGRERFYSGADKSGHAFQCSFRREDITGYAGKNLCEESFLLKCYECHQFIFRDCLLQIIDGREYMEIQSFRAAQVWSEDTRAIKTSRRITDRQRLSVLKTLPSSFCEFANAHMGHRFHKFNDFLSLLALSSLKEFLITNDRRKIKQCPYCKMFFTAKDRKRKKCYESICKNKYHQEDMRLRRDKNPLKYC
jgi:hypothetical protein